MIQIRLVPAATLVCWLISGGGPAQAQGTTSTSMSVTLVVEPACAVAVEPLDFATVDGSDAQAVGATAAIEVSCGADVPFTVALDGGQHSSNGTRRALDPASGRFLAYDIYADAAHTRRWGAEGQSVTGSTAGDGTARLTAHGVAVSALAGAGSYADVVTVTAVF